MAVQNSFPINRRNHNNSGHRRVYIHIRKYLIAPLFIMVLGRRHESINMLFNIAKNTRLKERHCGKDMKKKGNIQYCSDDEK